MPTERILVIDDDMYIRNACAEFLRSKGYDVSTAESGDAGIELLKASSYNLILTDLMMPGTDGLGVLKHVKENYPKTDVILITAHGTIENAVSAMKLGAYDYVTKNFELEELELIVKRCLERQRLSAEVRELKELVNLYEVSKAISSIMGIDELLNLILRLACDTLAADGGSIMLYNPETDDLSVKAALGERKDDILDKRLSLGERVAGYAAKEKKPVSVQGNLADDPRFAHLESFDQIESGITVPLSRKGRLLGVINLSRKETSAKFSQRDVQLLSIFAVEAAIAIENTYLFNNLEQEKEELNATFASMADGSVVTDARFNVVRLNQAAAELLGIAPDTSVGRNLVECLAHFDPSAPWDTIASSPGRSLSFELARRKGKALFLGVMATTIIGPENRPAGRILVLRDITDEKREEKLKMDFLALISHKIKTPLTTINGYAALLSDKAQGQDEKFTRGLSAIKKQGELLSVLVDKLLRFSLLISDYTKIGQERVTIDVIVDRCLKGLTDYLRTHRVEVTVETELRGLPPIWVDSFKVVEVIENLVENAVKFNPKEQKTVRVSGHRVNDRFIVVEVTDNGAGIPSEEQNKIFQKFYQIDEYFTGQIEGVGLGLALVKQIVELHGGEIRVRSTLGEGSTFSITLPLHTT